MKRGRSLFLIAALLSAACVIFAAADKPSPVSADSAYLQSLDQWKAELVQDLKQEWVPLAGLFWLKPGENSFGTDPGNAIVLPKGSAPAYAGSFQLAGKEV